MKYHDIPLIRWWNLGLFLVVAAALFVPAVWWAGPSGMLAALGAFFAAGLVAVAVSMAPMGWAALPALGFRRAGWRPIVLGTLGTAALSIGVSHLGIEPQGMKQAMEIAQEPERLLVSLVVLAGLAPLVEELVFRGLLYGWVAGRWGSIAAWVVSSLAFAAAHVEPAHAILVLPLGLWFGWLRRRTGSLWPSLVAHACNNGLAVGAAVLLGSG
ncbi:CPBP family intramembrane glutamic endopeptidase [Reyranella sp.]|uniref:CPBP family intramembrane glutamic endopeptidase n=1 Tax=Reyranella sp. TaxID=1929291 RepID=UPI003BA884C9